jgi:hypothetical protein
MFSKWFLCSVILLVLIVSVGIGGLVLAAPNLQTDGLPPAILSFTSDARTITVEALESGAAQIALSWQTVGLTDDFSLRLFALVVSEWTPLVDQNLPPVGSARLRSAGTADQSAHRDFAVRYAIACADSANRQF